MTASPFDDIKALIAGLPEASAPARAPAPALGRLGRVAAWLGRWSKADGPRILRPVVALYAGAYAADQATDLRARLETIAAGGATINALAQAAGAGLEAFDLAVDRPIGDMTQRAAMSERECAATMAFGMEALAKQPDLLILGSISIEAEPACAAIAMALFGGPASDWTELYVEQVDAAVARAWNEIGHAPDPLEVLREVGGREIAAMAGAILAARSQGVPVLLDGFGAAAAAAVLHAIAPGAVAHVRAGDLAPAPGHARLLARLEMEPVVDLSVALGEGCGAAAALGVLRAACEVG
ncbi:MAG TPA: nicotinate-nucleotide--dimethylbenzimidazole phosphoribosyltransferase [Caulobacteraceae bacterium]|nr:nicotinate-nucleotide--dimethylbenzimidazole phosphoribosyltransferase [Caulobacteraceae bacterium]